jgi:hypothetical protein
MVKYTRRKNKQRRGSKRRASKRRAGTVSRSPEKRHPKHFHLFDGDNEYEEKQKILRKGHVGDMVHYSPANQMGRATYVIRRNRKGEKELRQIADYEGPLSPASSISRSRSRSRSASPS